MNNLVTRVKLKQRLNKLASSDYVNLECWQESELLNKAQLQIIRRTIRDYDESTKLTIDDFNVLLTEKNIRTSNKDLFFETETLPDDYLYFKKVLVTGYRKDCENIKSIYCTLVEEANVEFLLNDFLKKPSFKWGETFVTLFGNKIRVWTNKDFLVKECKIVYYRYPKKIRFGDCREIDDIVYEDQPIEFRDEIAEIIIDEAAKIASGDINDFNNYQRQEKEVLQTK